MIVFLYNIFITFIIDICIFIHFSIINIQKSNFLFLYIRHVILTVCMFVCILACMYRYLILIQLTIWISPVPVIFYFPIHSLTSLRSHWTRLAVPWIVTWPSSTATPTSTSRKSELSEVIVKQRNYVCSISLLILCLYQRINIT